MGGSCAPSHVPQRYIFIEERRVLRLECRIAHETSLDALQSLESRLTRMLFNICSLSGSLTVYLPWKFWDTLSKKWLANVFLHREIVWLRGDVVQARLTCSCNSALVTDAWSEWTLAVVDIMLSKWPAKIQLSRVFWRVGCLSEDLTWLTHIRFQNKSTPIKRSISDDMWNRGSTKWMLRGKLNLSRPKENVGILPVIRSITMHSIAAV